MLIASIGDAADVYITGSLISSATILKSKNRVRGRTADPGYPESLYFEGGLYFDFKNEVKREKTIQMLKQMIEVHDDNVQLQRETGKDIVYPETDNSFFWGSLMGAEYQWGISWTPAVQSKSLDRFRFLTMRITVLVPFSEKKWDYNVDKAKLVISQRRFHSPVLLKTCEPGQAFAGWIDPGNSMGVRSTDGDLLLNTHQDNYEFNDTVIADKVSIFKFIVNNITSQILKTRETIPMRAL